MSHPITLMRHGRPLVAAGGWVHAAGMAGWIDGYNAALVADEAPATARALAASAGVVASSTLARAVSSARALGREPDLVDALFCEADLPHAQWRGVKLPPAAWALGFRLAWRCGYAGAGTSYRDSVLRAGRAAEMLAALAARGPVLLVGHGVFNRMIAAQLRARGWTASARQGSAYWSCATYRPA